MKLKSAWTSASPVSVVLDLMLAANVKSEHTRSTSEIIYFNLGIIRWFRYCIWRPDDLTSSKRVRQGPGNMRLVPVSLHKTHETLGRELRDGQRDRERAEAVADMIKGLPTLHITWLTLTLTLT